MGGSQVSLGNFGGILVSLEGLVGRLLSLVTNGKLSKVTVIIALPVKLSALKYSNPRGAKYILW